MNTASTGNSQSASEAIRFNLTQGQIAAPLLATPMHAGLSLNLAAIAVITLLVNFGMAG